MTEKEVK